MAAVKDDAIPAPGRHGISSGPILLSHLWQGESAKSQELLPWTVLSSNPHPTLAPSRVSVSVGLSGPLSQGEWQGGAEVTLQGGE